MLRAKKVSCERCVLKYLYELTRGLNLEVHRHQNGRTNQHIIVSACFLPKRGENYLALFITKLIGPE